MKIVLKDTVFCVTGSFDNFQNTRTVESALRARGGKITKSMAQKTEVLICGTGYTRKPETASDRGLPVLREPELLTLLEEGEIEIDFAPASIESGEESLDVSIAEARSLLTRPPGRALWDELVGLIDRSTPESQGPLISYLEEHLAQWSRREQRLCLAPRDWATQMTQGQDAPAYRLVRRLDLDRLDFKSTAVKKLLGCANLVDVHHLDLALRKPLTKTVFRALANDEKFAFIEHFALGFFDEDSVKELDGGVPWDNLRTLRFYPSDYWRVELPAYTALFTSARCAQVQKLIFTSRHSWGSRAAEILALLQDPKCLPAFHHFAIDFLHYGKTTNNPANASSVQWLLQGLAPETLARIDTFTFSTFVTGYYDSEQGFIDLSPLSRLKTARFYTLPPNNDDAADFPSRLDVVLHVDKMQWPDSLERIVTNVPLDHGAFARLKEARPDLTFVHDPLPEPIEFAAS